jgi:hypothetical protein
MAEEEHPTQVAQRELTPPVTGTPQTTEATTPPSGAKVQKTNNGRWGNPT